MRVVAIYLQIPCQTDDFTHFLFNSLILHAKICLIASQDERVPVGGYATEYFNLSLVIRQEMRVLRGVKRDVIRKSFEVGS